MVMSISDCRPGQRPGDVIGDFGFMFNEIDVENFKKIPSDL
jgi:hypothetical protein